MTVPPDEPPQERVTGLEPGGGVPPGETPPAEGSESWAGGADYKQPELGHETFWNRFGVVTVLSGAVLVGVLFLVYAILHAVNG
ncbi:hypothetical protein EV189_3143 [Motilibacter rhizosphaerae]|uniref:Uncharacterized protein n=1 Tax=Motilibacter rhizosphaerae TaxID=598652 RepID=A0A4Q7NG80_9ACTN|nr:DUF6480 family protein [Motilibacter rhizosphaerae]RZS82748.1 hypothetical protein EV189_3143 [Motilibacter rhizosphaerae]